MGFGGARENKIDECLELVIFLKYKMNSPKSSLKKRGLYLSSITKRISKLMSLNKKRQLREIAKIKCRELRKNSTKAERIFWELVRNRRFLGKKFYRQYPIFNDLIGKEGFYIADFYCHENKIVIEIDGLIHENRKIEDNIRSEIINQMGIKVIRFTNNDVENNLNNVLDSLGIQLKQ